MEQSTHKSIRQSLGALVDQSRRRVFGSNKSKPRHLQSASDITPSSSPRVSQNRFKKSDDLQLDISVLAMNYILQDNPTIQELVCLIVSLDDRDDDKFSEMLVSSAKFTLQLASFHEEDAPEASTAIAVFLTTMREIDIMARGGTETTESMNDGMRESITQIKSTHPGLGHHDRNIDRDKRLAGILDAIIGTTSTILNVFNQASGAIPVPFVKPLVASVAYLLTAVQQTRSNLDDMTQVATIAGEVVVSLAVACAGDEMNPSRQFQQALNRLQNKLRDIAQRCSELSHRNILWRFFQQDVDQNGLSAMKQDLRNAVAQFQTEAQLLQHLDLRSLGQVINNKLDEDAVNALPKPLSYVGRRDEYLPGSRSDVIQVIADWLENSSQLVFWLHGSAGLGKSTLAHEIVDSFRAEGRLATFTFLVRGSSSDPATVVQTMAKELCALHPRAVPEVAAAARTCNSTHLPLLKYMESYIMGPIRSLPYPYPLVIVIDGLDEWDHYEAFLKELEYIPTPPVKILLISRPSHSIERSLLNVPTKNFQLPPVSQDITEAYFNHRFEKIDWKKRKPSSFTISELSRLADGLLIWAAMVCSFLSYEMREGAPHELVDQIIFSGKQIALEDQLGNLYHDALKQLFRHDKEQILFRRVFGAMTVLQESLPLSDFARLLCISDDQVIGVQSRLTALQTRGAFDKHTVLPASHRFHSSFLEFTMDRGTEASTTLIPHLIAPQIAHQSMAEGCLSFLHRFLSSFRGTKCFHSNLHGLELYAVEFWPLHVANSNDRFTPLSPKLENLLLKLAETHLRRWGSLFLAVSLPLSQDWDQVVGSIDADEFYCLLADLLQNNMKIDAALASRRIFSLEVAVRLQPKLQKAWQGLGDAYQKQFNRSNSLDLLNNAIVVYRHALELCSKDEGHLIMSELGYALWSRFTRTGLAFDLEEAILMQRKSLSHCLPTHPDRFLTLTRLGLGLCDRSHRTGSMADLEEAIAKHRESLSLRPAPHPDRSTSFNNFANALLSRFGKTGSIIDLEETISMYRELLSLRPAPHPDRSIALNNLANALRDCFGNTGSMTDLEEAISMHRESLSLRPAPHPDRSMSLNNLASTLQDRFGKIGSMMDLEEAISMHRESLSLRPAPHPDRSMSLNNLASALQDRFVKTGPMTDLEEAISMHRESLSLRPAPHPDRSMSLNNLASALQDRFVKTGSMTDLEEAISMHRESLSLRPAPHPHRSMSLNNLASTLQDRFGKTGSMTDLEEAISMHRESLSLRPAPHPYCAMSLYNLASSLRDRFKMTGSITDLEEATVMLRESLSLLPPFHPRRIWVMNNLAYTLETQFETTGTQSDLDEATSLRQEILSISESQ